MPARLPLLILCCAVLVHSVSAGDRTLSPGWVVPKPQQIRVPHQGLVSHTVRDTATPGCGFPWDAQDPAGVLLIEFNDGWACPNLDLDRSGSADAADIPLVVDLIFNTTVLFEDDFQRPDSTFLGYEWSEQIGTGGCLGCDAAIESGTLRVDDEAGGSEMHLQAWHEWDPGSAEDYSIHVLAKASQTNETLIILQPMGGFGHDEHLFALHFGSSGYIEFFDGAFSSQLMPYSAATWYGFDVSIDTAAGLCDICVDVECYWDLSLESATAPSQIRLGGTGPGIGTVFFDDFQANAH